MIARETGENLTRSPDRHACFSHRTFLEEFRHSQFAGCIRRDRCVSGSERSGDAFCIFYVAYDDGGENIVQREYSVSDNDLHVAQIDLSA